MEETCSRRDLFGGWATGNQSMPLKTIGFLGVVLFFPLGRRVQDCQDMVSHYIRPEGGGGGGEQENRNEVFWR
jgi:hypothetical protein